MDLIYLIFFKLGRATFGRIFILSYVWRLLTNFYSNSDVNIGSFALEACSATLNLVTNSAFALGLKGSHTENLSFLTVAEPSGCVLVPSPQFGIELHGPC